MGALGVRCWGTRGIISSPRPDTRDFGGNTTCIELLGSEHVVVVDTGFGVSLLGEKLLPRIVDHKEELEIHIFFSHFHWDHIQGLPFFHPIYFPSTTLNLYSPHPSDYMWESLDILFDGSYSPFSGIRSMPSTINVVALEDAMSLGDLQIDFHSLEHVNHSDLDMDAATYAYRFAFGGQSVVIATDHEASCQLRNRLFLEFASGVNLLVHDAQYIEGEERAIGFGHATTERALGNARHLEPELTLLTHHDPCRSDAAILEETARLRKQFADLRFEFARESRAYHLQ